MEAVRLGRKAGHGRRQQAGMWRSGCKHAPLLRACGGALQALPVQSSRGKGAHLCGHDALAQHRHAHVFKGDADLPGGGQGAAAEPEHVSGCGTRSRAHFTEGQSSRVLNQQGRWSRGLTIDGALHGDGTGSPKKVHVAADVRAPCGWTHRRGRCTCWPTQTVAVWRGGERLSGAPVHSGGRGRPVLAHTGCGY